MPTRLVFSDQDDNEMDCYLNSEGKVYIGVAKAGDDNIYSGYITLDKNDVGQLIKILHQLESEIKS